MVTSPSDQRVDRLSSRAEITEVVLRYVRAVDRCDESLLRSCFHPDSTHEHGAFRGASSDFCGFAMEILQGTALTHHQLGPVSIEFEDAETAFAETYFTSHHRYGPIPPTAEEPGEDRIMGGRYVDRFERRDGAWRIAHRRGINEWLRHTPGCDRGFFERPPQERGRRDREDPVYGMRAARQAR